MSEALYAVKDEHNVTCLTYVINVTFKSFVKNSTCPLYVTITLMPEISVFGIC